MVANKTTEKISRYLLSYTWKNNIQVTNQSFNSITPLRYRISYLCLCDQFQILSMPMRFDSIFTDIEVNEIISNLSNNASGSFQSLV